MTALSSNRVLVVDDEPSVLDAIEDTLADGFDVIKQSDPEIALETIANDDSIAVVISDQRMPGLPGVEFLEKVRKHSGATRLLITGYADLEAVVKAVNCGRVFGYISKPWDTDSLRFLVLQAAERFQLQREAAHERELLANLMDHVPDAIYFKDRQFRYIRVNRAHAKLLGFSSPAEAEGKLAASVAISERMPEIEAEERRIFATCEPVVDRVQRLVTRDGEERWLSVTKAPVYNEQGKCDRLVAIARDVTARRNAEEALRQREAALRHAEQLARLGHRVFDAQSSRFHGISTTLVEILGVGWANAPTTLAAWLAHVHPEDREQVEAHYAGLAREMPVNRVSYRLLRADRSRIYVEEMLERLETDSNTTAGSWFSTVQDVTERRMQERELNLLLSVTKAVAEARDETHAMQSVLERVCDAAGWEYGEIWVPASSDNPRLVCHEAWYTTRKDIRKLREAAESLSFNCGEGFIGRACAKAELTWIPDISVLGETSFFRKAVALEHGVTGAVVVPVPSYSGDRVVAMLSFFMFSEHIPDERFARVVASVAEQLGTCFERLEASRRLAESERQIRSVAEHLPGVIFKWAVSPDGSQAFRYVSPKARKLLGVDESFVLSPQTYWSLVHEDDVARVRADVAVCVQTCTEHDMVYRIRHQDGTTRWLHASAMPAVMEDGTTEFHGVLLDVTDQMVAEERAKYLSEYDPSTGLLNRVALTSNLEATLEAAADNARTAVLHVAIDQLQTILESCGHSQTERLIKRVGERLQRNDMANGFLSRIEGNEFVMVIPNLSRRGMLGPVLKDLSDRVGQPIVVDGQDFHVTASIGIAMAPEHAKTADQLLRASAIACDRARMDGGDSHCFYAKQMAKTVERRMSLDTKLRKAVMNEELELYFQPVVNALTGTVEGAEALLRWPQKSGGFVSPAEFIPLAEETGLILPIGRWVMCEAMSQAVRFAEQGVDPGRIHVNISPRQIARGDVASLIESNIADTGCPADRLELEITESAFMDQIDVAFKQIESFRALGLRVAIDDFGTGYSSLSYLRELPVDTLKLDRSFVRNMTTDPRAAALVNGVIDLAHGLGIRVVAEGVEKEQELTFLRAYRCDAIQGYHVARPMTAQALAGWLRGRPRLADRNKGVGSRQVT